MFPKSGTVSSSEVGTSSARCNTRDFLCYLWASGEIIWQLVRANGYSRTFPPIAKDACSIFCKMMKNYENYLHQNFIVADCSPLSAVHRASCCLTNISVLSQGNQLFISSFALIFVSQAMKKKAQIKKKIRREKEKLYFVRLKYQDFLYKT